jgi:hypothetical protein
MSGRSIFSLLPFALAWPSPSLIAAPSAQACVCCLYSRVDQGPRSTQVTYSTGGFFVLLLAVGLGTRTTRADWVHARCNMQEARQVDYSRRCNPLLVAVSRVLDHGRTKWDPLDLGVPSHHHTRSFRGPGPVNSQPRASAR